MVILQPSPAQSSCYSNATAESRGRFLPLAEVESDKTVQYQSYKIFWEFKFKVYQMVEDILLIISHYLKQKAHACS
jgi:hypothetical protein